MKSQFDKTLEEVWKWKEEVYNDIKDMTWEEQRRYFEEGLKRIEEQYGFRLKRYNQLERNPER